ncbi:MAG: hypothetical protein IPK35_13130 [Saprospiraceae bacterium]|nr:hypothetical protein [Saprospiraceae bacterium]
MSATNTYYPLSTLQLLQVWVLIFFTFSLSFISALHYDFCTQTQYKTASISENNGLRLSTIFKNDIAPFSADLATKSQQQLPSYFFRASSYECAILIKRVKPLLPFNYFEIISWTNIASRKLIFPHHTFW